MKILLVEPAYRRKSKAMIRGDVNISDDSLWYPPIGLMKIARFHKDRGDEVFFVAGIPDYEVKFDKKVKWDIIYVTTTFTFYFKKVVETINYFKKNADRIVVGGILATLMSADILVETGIEVTVGLLKSARFIGFDDDTNIDELIPDYSILDGRYYAVNNTFYAYTTRGCRIGCPWCAVPSLEPNYEPYIDIKQQIINLRAEYGEKGILKLMDNNVLISEQLKDIIDDLVELGYSRNMRTTLGKPGIVDFNQGVDASHINIKTIKLLSKINISPLRIAFDKISERKIYINAVELAFKNGFKTISNYMLYNFRDTPKDLYERVMVNIRLNEKWKTGVKGKAGQIYCYPMRYAPINEKLGVHANRNRNFFKAVNTRDIDWLKAPVWTPKFSRNIDVMKGVAHGAVPTVASLAKRTFGRNLEEFVTNLYMPEDMLRNRDKYEHNIHAGEKPRALGNGEIEEFRKFILSLLRRKSESFYFFHNAVTPNSKITIREALTKTRNQEIIKWLNRYLTPS